MLKMGKALFNTLSDPTGVPKKAPGGNIEFKFGKILEL